MIRLAFLVAFTLASLASLNGAMPEAVDPPLPPNMSPDAPATVLIA